MRRPCAFDGCETGASKDGFCATHDPNRPPVQMLAAEPLVRLVEARGGPMGCGAEPGSSIHKGYFEIRRQGRLSMVRADRYAHALLGCHPCEVWPEWFGATA